MELLNSMKFRKLPIANRMKVVGWLMLAAGAFGFVRAVYIRSAVSAITNGLYVVDNGSAGQFLIFAGVIVLIGAEIYRRGCLLQEEKDFTI